MELRGQDKETGMPSTLGYNSPNKDSSSSKLTSSSALATSSLRDRIRDQIGHGNSIFNPPPQTLDHHQHLPFHHHQPQQLNPQQQQPPLPLKSPRRDPDQDPDPVPPPSATATPAPNAASTAVNAAAAASSSSSSSVRYRECLKNHAASTGGHVLDGCGEFMPSGEDGSSEALKCAACECHRNFHRKEIDGESSQYVPNSAFYSYNPNNNKENGRRSSLSTLPHAQHHPPHQLSLQPHLHHQQQQQHHHHHHHLRPIPPMMMAFGGGGGTAAESTSEDLNMFRSNYVGGQASAHHRQPISGSKKRFRTKFTQPQKDRMVEFAEKLGWKIQKHDDQEVQQFCSEVGVKRKAFKVWMHNNKQAMKKKQEV